MKIIECIPNFSEGKNKDIINQIVSEITKLNYNDSLILLKNADGRVKTAIVMEMKQYSRKQARDKLDSMNGSLLMVLSED